MMTSEEGINSKGGITKILGDEGELIKNNCMELGQLIMDILPILYSSLKLYTEKLTRYSLEYITLTTSRKTLN